MEASAFLCRAVCMVWKTANGTKTVIRNTAVQRYGLSVIGRLNRIPAGRLIKNILSGYSIKYESGFFKTAFLSSLFSYDLRDANCFSSPSTCTAVLPANTFSSGKFLCGIETVLSILSSRIRYATAPSGSTAYMTAERPTVSAEEIIPRTIPAITANNGPATKSVRYISAKTPSDERYFSCKIRCSSLMVFTMSSR